MPQPTDAEWANLRDRETRLLQFAGTPVEQHDVTIGQHRIHYLTAGETTLPTLVMLHGRGSASAMWLTAMAQLAQHRHLVMIDMPGWGLSSRTPFTGTTGQSAVEWWRDAVLGTIDALNIQRFDLMGHSLGGLIALAVALERQQQIDHLISEDGAGFASVAPFAVRLYFNLEPERLARIVTRSVFNYSTRNLINRQRNSPELLREFSDFVYALTTFPGTPQSGALAFNKYVSVSGVHFSLRERVPEIKILTRAIWGEKDTTVPLADSRAGIALLPYGELKTIPGIMHSPHMEAPDQFSRLVLEFLARGTEIPVTQV